MKTKHSLAENFKFAFAGIGVAVSMGRNIKIMIGIGLLAILTGLLLNIGRSDWTDLILIISLVLSLEMLNTALEAIVDLVSPDYNQKAKIAKDMAAGSVLLASAASIFVGIAIFLPKILH